MYCWARNLSNEIKVLQSTVGDLQKQIDELKTIVEDNKLPTYIKERYSNK